MPYTLIKGVFEPLSGQPDGDSVRFNCDNDDLFDKIEGFVEFKTGGEVQLRYEGVDALEKAALRPFSSDATRRNIELLGFDSSTDSSSPPGYILTQSADKNGRPVCFVFAGDTEREDGETVRLEIDELKTSINYQLLEDGFLYPMFYETLYQELRDALIGVKFGNDGRSFPETLAALNFV